MWPEFLYAGMAMHLQIPTFFLLVVIKTSRAYIMDVWMSGQELEKMSWSNFTVNGIVYGSCPVVFSKARHLLVQKNGF